MKVTNLKLKNIKCFKEADIPFENDKGQVKNWSLIIGDNGQGKTTLLRSLALGLGNVSEASGLLQELHGGFLREGEDKGFVEVTLKDQSNKKYKIKTTIELKGNSEIVSQNISHLQNNKWIEVTNQNIEKSIRDQIFIVGYGASRGVSGDKYYEEYAIIDSVYSLFNYEINLQNADSGIRKITIGASNEKFEKLKPLLKEILMLKKEDDVTLEQKALYIKSQWGKVSLNSLSDGYRSLTTVIMDFLYWRLLYDIDGFNLYLSDLKPQNQQDFNIQEKRASQSSVQKKDSNTNQISINNPSGIFIIDEIEQHLHPKWQRRILKILSDQFPNIQFIATTHTPICVLGLNDLECESQLIKAGYENSHSEVSRPINMKEAYKGYRVDQILTSPDIFDLTSSRSQSMENKLKEYREIYLKDAPDRTNSEKQRMQELEQELKDLPMWDTVQDRKTIDELKNLLAQKNKGIEHDKN